VINLEGKKTRFLTSVGNDKRKGFSHSLEMTTTSYCHSESFPSVIPSEARNLSLQDFSHSFEMRENEKTRFLTSVRNDRKNIRLE